MYHFFMLEKKQSSQDPQSKEQKEQQVLQPVAYKKE